MSDAKTTPPKEVPTTPAPGTPPPAPEKSKRPRLLQLLATVCLLAALAWGSWYGFYGRWQASTDNAYVHGDIVQITPQFEGTVVSINADDGELVHAGDTLVSFDPSDSQLALDRAASNLANVVRKVRGLYSATSGSKAEMAVRQATLDKARADYQRRRALAGSGAISHEELAHASNAFLEAQSALEAIRQQYQINLSLVDNTELASHPEIQAAITALRVAFLERSRATLLAPVTGYIAKRQVQLGQRVQSGEPLMAVVPLDNIWIEANFTETQLRDIRIGQPVSISTDLYGHAVRYAGQVQRLGIGTGAAFALLPAQNATGNWIKIVQRVPVRISLTQPEQLVRHPLRIGLSMQVNVDLHDRSGALLAPRPQKPSLTTDVYQDRLQQAESLIEKIVQANIGAADGGADE